MTGGSERLQLPPVSNNESTRKFWPEFLNPTPLPCQVGTRMSGTPRFFLERTIRTMRTNVGCLYFLFLCVPLFFVCVQRSSTTLQTSQQSQLPPPVIKNHWNHKPEPEARR
mmetsp:Transcript_31331/g.62581  ORF Transcript_31331/g.62581 Transcript_31331/m.62581 type:complete len:111 (-) Transcript_31331:19-351(-)